jgi:hypothetical protein
MASQSDLKAACETIEAYQAELDNDLAALSENLDLELEALQLQVSVCALRVFDVGKTQEWFMGRTCFAWLLWVHLYTDVHCATCCVRVCCYQKLFNI